MDKSKAILREGYVYREEKLNGQSDVLYCILKPNTLSFHRRKVHKRHTPLGLLKLEELTVDSEGQVNSGVDEVDCNNNSKRFPWEILSNEHKLFLYCASFEERTAWVTAIEEAKHSLSSRENGETLGKEDYTGSTTKRTQQEQSKAEVNPSVDSNQLLSPKSINNSSHSEAELDNGVRKDVDSIDTFPPERKQITRIRSRSLSEVEKPSDCVGREQLTRYLKSKSAPPDNGKRGCKTVDKLIDVHSGLCRQFIVRWI